MKPLSVGNQYRQGDSMKKIVLSLMLVSLLAGCATQGTNSLKYTEPEIVKINNEVVVNKQHSIVWDSIVKQISKSFYIINNIDKESRIINVSFSSNKPEDYIDCGKSIRTYTQKDNVETFQYAVAGASYFKMAGDQQPHPAWASYAVVHRMPILEGRANIYIAPNETDLSKSTITVNTRYVWTVNLRGESFTEHASGRVVSHGPINIPPSTPMAFNTLSKGESTDQSQKIYCVSKGIFEKEILGLATK